MQIEDYKNFSESLLWKIQENAYQGFGISAWYKKGVPAFLTSHPWTAACYRQVVAGFLQDCQPFETTYIFDLGAGTGQFAFHFLKESLPFPIQYIVTDIVKENLSFILNHPLLKNDAIQGKIFHVPFKETFAKMGKAPLVLIANYFFDTIPQELYRIEKGTLFQGEVALEIDQDFFDPLDTELIPQLKLKYRFEKQVPSNRILDYFLAMKTDMTFLYPAYAIQVLEYFAKLTEGPILLLASDQALCTQEQHFQEKEPALDLHGSFSLPVSYMALEQFCDKAWLPFFPASEFTTMAAIYNSKLTFSNVEIAYNATLRWLDPWHHWQAVQEGEAHLRSLHDFLLLLRLSFYDPTLIYQHFTSLRRWIQEATLEEKHELQNALEKVAENFYPIGPEDGDFLINLAVLAIDLKDEKKALYFLDRAALFTNHRELIKQNLQALLKLRTQGYFS